MKITRFAPSPTGYLHIGGVRTAIFNWALARQSGGRFYLRIDDTDANRHVDDAVAKIIEDFAWLGLDIDKPVKPEYAYQSLRTDAYLNAAEKLFDIGLAYRDSERRLRFNVKEYAQRKELDSVVTVNDLVLGAVNVPLDSLEDFSLLRSDDRPLYNLATAVDDCEMGITHVVRGAEHLSNTLPQRMIADGLGYEANTYYAHIPFICPPPPHPPRKLSKRDAAELGIPVTLEEYRNLGYLPSAMFNYLTHLGWGMDAETEIWNDYDFVAKFMLEDVGSKPSPFDPKKLLWVQQQHMTDQTLAVKVESAKKIYDPGDDDALGKVITAMGPRFVVSADILPHRHFIDDKLLPLVEIDEYEIVVLKKYSRDIQLVNQWAAVEFEQFTKDFAVRENVKIKILVKALRLALTGSDVGFSLYETMAILGKSKICERLERGSNEPH